MYRLGRKYNKVDYFVILFKGILKKCDKIYLGINLLIISVIILCIPIVIMFVNILVVLK